VSPSTGSGQALSFEDVQKGFDGQPVLTGFSANVSTDEVTFVVGASGQGKSVLCRLAVGLLRPDAGAITLFGERVDTLPERALVALRRRAPYVVQGPALLDTLTLAGNVALAARGEPQKAPRALTRVGLEAQASRFPHEVGPGVQKRCAIARALVLEPEYLLFDEPTTGLDRRAARQVNEAIAELKRQGLGALVVSHDYGSLAEVADRVLGVAGGRAAFHLTPDRFLESSEPAILALLGKGELSR
jgi:phospholipid/cholesterol/gamma-HCH transport system ATP-binding protein